ncbi:MAG: 50S ribosomal protein L6, partial [Chloroflexi bacterium]|nr:50S ribosomal protein L6 [Chloroflexota bacterium]
MRTAGVSAGSSWRTSGRSTKVSRVGKKPIPIPSGVSVEVADGEIVVKGQRGELRQAVNPGISVQEEEGALVVRRASDDREQRALHGLTR